MLAVTRPTRTFATGGVFVSAASFFFVFFSDILVSFSVRPGIIASLVISVSPDKAGPPVTGRGIARLHKRSAEAGETLAGIGPVFRQKFTIKAGKYGYGRCKETLSLHTIDKTR